MAAAHPEIRRVGYFGSYARGDWGPGSDLDIVLIVEHAREPFERRAVSFDALALPVPADIFVYTEDEWKNLDRHGRLWNVLSRETVWLDARRPLGRPGS